MTNGPNVSPRAEESLSFGKTRLVIRGLGAKGTSAGFEPWSGHRREVMAPARLGPGMGQPTGATAEWWWIWSDKSAAIFLRGDECVIYSLFSPKTVCA
jgi:hypothetical protein